MQSWKALIFIFASIGLLTVSKLTWGQSPPAPPTLTAKLVEPEKKAQKKAATVEVTVTGLQLIDADKVGEVPAAGQGHLHYQLDGGVIVATTATKLSFHGLTPGSHQISVGLAANDHSPMGAPQMLTVTIGPAAAKPAAPPPAAPAPKSGGY